MMYSTSSNGTPSSFAVYSGVARFAPMPFEYFLAFETAYAHDSPLP